MFKLGDLIRHEPGLINAPFYMYTLYRINQKDDVLSCVTHYYSQHLVAPSVINPGPNYQLYTDIFREDDNV